MQTPPVYIEISFVISNIHFPLDLPLTPPEIVNRDGSLPRGMKPIGSSGAAGGGRLAAWIIDSGSSLDQVHKEVTQVQQNLAQLSRILEHIETSQSIGTSINTADNEVKHKKYQPYKNSNAAYFSPSATERLRTLKKTGKNSAYAKRNPRKVAVWI